MSVAYLGIDLAKLTFDAALLMAQGKAKHRTLSNDEAGYEALADWLHQSGITDPAQLHACLEATGHYGNALARYLHAGAYILSVVNPAAIGAFARTKLSRTKTDKSRCRSHARYCPLHRPPAWTPPAEESATLVA
ncbi:MAG TPA: transposase [Chloroflexota bacterium]|nr:transposase [Chloroflexota bacterium]